MKRKYFLYAGYHELWISEKQLGRPLTYIGYARTLSGAIAKAQRYDPDVCVCFDRSLRAELKEYYEEQDFICDEETVNKLMDESYFLNGDKYDLGKGICELTAECLKNKFEIRLSFPDIREIAMFLHYKTKESFRNITRKITGRTYRDVYPRMAEYL